MKSIRPKPQKLDPSTRFKDGPDSINRRTISDFWQWAYSDLMQNIERAVLAEYIVAALIGVDNKLRVPWLAYDLKLPNGKTVEVKTMSKLQAWYQKRLSNPRVVIKPTRKWDPKTNLMEDTPEFHSDLYVICFFTAVSHDACMQVGKRRTSTPTILAIDVSHARRDGIRFYKATNKVYLCEHVPAKYISART